MEQAEFSERFPRYRDHDPPVEVRCVTPSLPGSIHRFFDSSPFSPSGRFLAVTRMRREDRLPAPGEPADVAVVDLAEGREEIVAETRGWDTQLGAQAQWGASDHELFFNDVDVAGWRPFGVKLDPGSGRRAELEGPVYGISPDGRLAAAPCLLRTGRTQVGYGVLAPPERIPRNRGAPDDDGLYLTDTATGRRTLLVSFADIVAAAPQAFPSARFGEGAFYGFHASWNAQGSRVLFVARFLPADGGRRLRSVVVVEAATGRIAVPVPASLWRRGHHPRWAPDGEHITMNLDRDGEGLRFARLRWDGTRLETLHPRVRGSGHPTLHPDGRHLVCDAKPKDALAWRDGSVPLRWVDLAAGSDQVLARMAAQPAFPGPEREMRVDLHPAFDRAYRHVAFNGWAGGARRVYVATLPGAGR